MKKHRIGARSSNPVMLGSEQILELDLFEPATPRKVVGDRQRRHRRADELSGNRARNAALNCEACQAARSVVSGKTVSIIGALTKAQERIKRYTEIDAVTGLPNLMGFQGGLGTLLARASCGGNIGLIILDVDDFKRINSALGQQLGDTLLRQVGDRIRQEVGDGVVARLGDDEFAIAVCGFEATTEIAKLTEKIACSLAEPFILDGHQVHTGASMGVAAYPKHAASGDELLHKAELALCEAKRLGRSSVCFYEDALSTRLCACHRTVEDLWKALVRGEFELHYQPIIRLADYRMSGAEALVRWRHPDRGMISPAEFIPVAEETELIVPLGEWIIRRACADAARWPDPIKVAINLSPRQFKQPNLVDIVVKVLSAARLPATRLALEITESTLLSDNEANLHTLHQLRKLGVCMVLDDFGTGYSSLNYLRCFPFQKIKIDHSFVNDVTSNKESAEIVRTIVMLARNLGMTTVAEGVERSEQLAVIRFEGCDEMQGYFASPPRPACEFNRLHALPTA